MEKRQQKIAERYKNVLQIPANEKNTQLELPISYFQSGFAFPLMPIVKHDGIFLFHWGLIPHWVKDETTAKDIRMKTLNAVGETIWEKSSFRKCIANKRCLIPVNGFYEWRDVNKVKYPYYIRSIENDIFSLGGIYEEWLNKVTGEVIHSFSIVTTQANPLMEKIHNLKKRMPLILHQSDEEKWLNPSLPQAEVNSLIQPFPQDQMNAYTISKNANSSRYNRNVPEILEKVNYPELEG